jgi:tRNA(Ile)-lysidine synthase
VALAVSGGPDSAALLILARGAGLVGTAFHVDHGLRAGSDAEAPVVASMAAGLGFAFRSVQVQVAAGADLEARARRARYAALPRGVLTGHTMDDQAETVLLNLMRGAGADGLAGMREDLDVVRRPLLGLRRAQTEEVCRRFGVEPLRDPSNSERRFRRNRVRHEVLPLLSEIAARDVVPVLARQAGFIGEEADLLDRLAADVDPTDVAGLRAAPAALARRSLRRWLRWGPGHHPPSSSELLRVIEVVAGDRRACELSGGRRVSRRAGRLYLDDPGTASP